MAKHQGVIEAISHKYDKFAILFEEKWYNTKAEYAKEWPVQPAVGDEISWDDGGKKYLGKMKIVKKNTAAPAAGGAPVAGNYNVGVEVGHASKLAMDMALAKFGNVDAGSPVFYRFWAEETLKIHGMMTKLKAKVAAGNAPKVAAEPAEEEVQVITKKETPEPELDADDLF